MKTTATLFFTLHGFASIWIYLGIKFDDGWHAKENKANIFEQRISNIIDDDFTFYNTKLTTGEIKVKPGMSMATIKLEDGTKK